MSFPEDKTLPKEYFERIYEADSDPWKFATSSYEAEKYAATLNALPRSFYSNAFEIGCSIGVLTEKLAEKCGKLLAVDVSEKALGQAAERCARLNHVSLELMHVPHEFPSQIFDLIVVSEVGYYLSQADWRKTVAKICGQTASQAHVALVHWRPFVHDYPQTGDEIHQSFSEYVGAKMNLLNSIQTEKYNLDVWQKS